MGFRHSGMRLLAQARNPYSLQGLWIPGSRFARPGMTIENFRSNSPHRDAAPFNHPFGGDSGCTISLNGGSASQWAACAVSAG